MIIPIILCGGSGTRLWPLSRKLHPKQFISLINKNTLFQDTVLRLPKDASNPIIVCNEEHRFLAAEQLRQIERKSNGIILEPIGKNTAPAIALASMQVIKDFKDAIILVLPADHLINNIQKFHESITIAKNLAENNKLVTFGVLPTKAETGFGYIEAEMTEKSAYYKIKSFIEKPNQKDADKYLDSGDFLWNSGMFMLKPSIYLEELKKFQPEIYDKCKKSFQTSKDEDFIRINKEIFLKCPDKSIDFAVMEYTQKAVVVPYDGDWSDVGSWTSLMNSKNKDKDGNVCEGDVVLDDVKNTFAYSSSRLVSATGVSDLIIIDTQDALLVTNVKNAHNTKNIINKLKSSNRKEAEFHRKVYRPWGHYDLIDVGIGFQAKRILVNPGAKLSLQKHNHRAEHWVVVRGTATITCGKETFKLSINQSTFIPLGEIHRLENNQETILEIIEIQTGDYLGEDDIIRLDDDYKRV